MPMIPEAVIAMLASARIGAIHVIVFGGFGAKELSNRINHAEPVVIVSASCGIESNRLIEYKPILDQAVTNSAHKPKKCIVVQREMLVVDLNSTIDVDYSDELASARPHDCVPVAATDPIYMLHTSGTTGEPKAIVRPSGGHAVALYWTMKNVYDVTSDEVFWAASDLGWVVGHSYIAYAPLLYGCTSILYEGKPVGTPDAGAIFRAIRQHGCSSVFISPTAVRAIRREDPEGLLAAKYKLPKLRSFFMAGEICDHNTMNWIEEVINRGSNGNVKQVVDHWWQTESGWSIGAMCLGLGDRAYTKSSNVGKPVPGWNVKVLNSKGEEVSQGQMGNLAVKLPLPPGAMSTIWKNDEKFVKTYFTKFPGYYDTLDSGRFDEFGHVNVLARTDDIINVAGHRLSTGALEESVASCREVVECAVVGLNDMVKGEVPLALVVLRRGVDRDASELKNVIVSHVRETVGPVASLKDVVFVPRLPKTRTAKLSRSTMKALANGEPFTPPPTLEDVTVLDEIKCALGEAGIGQSHLN
ncbi:acyl-CoA synthetase short-chain family member 3, mitochondrial-like [Corticium candelabrum]|uniref:acyl-CoA synthetase short-chain family member 3, mitochondrial-like n=1 Tax=Corticium candelabrum TaxID=121492 RepID=UPI002E274D4F|nr:acyl-CoA synthetase short-chain family member 3, mitochondrial-like [Corticium candelabrum]